LLETVTCYILVDYNIFFVNVYPRSATALDFASPLLVDLETLSRAAAFADNLDFLGVASPVVTDELQTTFLGTTRSAAIGTAITATDGIPDGLGRATSMFHVIVAVLFFPASWGYGKEMGRLT
jgi:hypothetical protein